MRFAHRSHFCEKAKGRVAGEAVCPEANIESHIRQPLQRESPVPKIAAAAWTMGDVKPRSILQAAEIALGQLVEMDKNPALVDRFTVEY